MSFVVRIRSNTWNSWEETGYGYVECQELFCLGFEAQLRWVQSAISTILVLPHASVESPLAKVKWKGYCYDASISLLTEK